MHVFLMFDDDDERRTGRSLLLVLVWYYYCVNCVRLIPAVLQYRCCVSAGPTALYLHDRYVATETSGVMVIHSGIISVHRDIIFRFQNLLTTWHMRLFLIEVFCLQVKLPGAWGRIIIIIEQIVCRLQCVIIISQNHGFYNNGKNSYLLVKM